MHHFHFANLIGWLAVMVFSTHSVLAQTQSSAERILGEHIEALGGLEKIEAITSAYSKGVMKIATSDVEFQIELRQKGGKYLLTMKHSDIEIVQSSDGTVAWEKNSQGYRLLEASESIAARNNNCWLVPAKTWVDGSFTGEIQLVGREEVERVNCFVVDFIPVEGVRVRRYFDPETYMIRRFKSVQKASPEPITIQVKETGLREVEGVLVPFKQQFAADGQLFYTIEFSERIANPRLDDGLFELPAQVKALLDQK